MAAPTLRIPVALDLSEMKNQTAEAAKAVTSGVDNIVKVFGRANDQLNKVQLGVTPMKLLSTSSKVTSVALEGVATGLSAVGNAAGEASKVVPVLGAVSTAANTAAIAATGLSKAATGVGAASVVAGTSWKSLLLGFSVAAGTFYLLSKAIQTAREQLEEMVKIGEKAGNVGVSPEFFQQFTREADKARVSVTVLEGALKNAFEATKAQPLIDSSKWDFGTEKIHETEKLLRILNAEGGKLEELELFRNAPDQNQKIEAVLKAMIKLEEQGRNIQALQVGESFFGKEFADSLRKGETSATKMLQTIQETQKAGSGIFSDEMVKQAEEVDKRLKVAHTTLTRELRPVWNDLANTILFIKNSWSSIVELIAEAAKLANSFDLALKKERLEKVQTAIATGESTIAGIPRVPEGVRSALGATQTVQDRLIAERDQLQKEIAAAEAQGKRPFNIGVVRPPAGLPTRKPEPGAGDGRDRLQTSAEAIEKRTAALNAETGAIDLGTEARERAKITAELETIAVQLNTAAGEENTAVNEKQRATIDRVAEAYGKAAKAAEDARGPLRSFIREGANVNKQLEEVAVKGLRGLEDALFDIVTGAATAQEAFKKLADAMIADLIRLSIRLAINNALMAVMNGLSGGASGVISSGAGFVSAKPPMFAEGGFLGAGKWGIAGENGPELIRGPAQVISNADSFGGGPSFTYAPMIDARGADVAAVSKLAQIVARDRMEFESRVKMIVRERPGKRW